MPPSVRDWVPEGHLVWTVLDAVGELDLSAFYAAYRVDGHGRPAYEPSMMVALLLYAYARGNRSSRGIERACVEDVAYRVVAGNLVPDHSTIAEFRCRHERALGEVFSGVLGLCARAGLASIGVVAIDGTKMSANASMNANRDFGQIAREILDEAAEIDRREDELYGERARRRAAGASAHARGPPQGAARGQGAPGARTRPARRGSGRRRRWRGGGRARSAASSSRVRRVGGRGCARAAGRWRHSASARLARSRRTGADRLFEACRRLEEELDSSTPRIAPMRPGARAGSRPTGRGGWRPGWSSRTSCALAPSGLVNVTDHDSRVVRTQGQPPLQGYNAQLVGQRPPDRRWPPRSRPSRRTSGTWNRWSAPPNANCARSSWAIPRSCWPTPATGISARSNRSPATASRCSSRPTAGCARAPGRAGPAASTTFMRRVLATPEGRDALPPAPDHHRAGLRPDQVQPRDQTLPTPRPNRLPQRMATDRRHPQHPQAPQPPPRGRHALRNGGAGRPPVPRGARRSPSTWHRRTRIRAGRRDHHQPRPP